MERILGIVLIANEVMGDHLEHALADNVVNQIQIILLHRDLIRVPSFDNVWRHPLLKQPALSRILNINAFRVLVPYLGMCSDVFHCCLIGLQIVANNVRMRTGELLARRDCDVCGSAAALVRSVFLAEIDQHPVSLLGVDLDGLCRSEQRRIHVSLAQ